MEVVIRVDASIRIGLGHVMRCRTLAHELVRQGATVRFITRAHAGHCIDRLKGDGFAVHPLPAPRFEASGDTDYAGWLGVSVAEDAEQTAAAIPDSVDWLIVDHYGLDENWEAALRWHARRIFAIDDLANRPHNCDLLLDQNYAGDGVDRYKGLVPTVCKQLLGPRFAMLHPAFQENRPVDIDKPEKYRAIERIFVFFGGTDPDNLTGRALQALSEPDLTHSVVDCVVGANNPHQSMLAEIAEQRGNIRLHAPQPHLADLMARADLAIGAGGTTTWERCALGLPSIVVSIAENQRSACEALARDDYIDYLGHHDTVTVPQIADAIRALINQPDTRHRLARASADLVDGQGTQRVVESMMEMTKKASAVCH